RMKVESALKDAGLNLRQATIRLQERLGTSTFNSVNISGGLEFSAADPGLEALRQLALTERSDIQAAARELDAANERLKLERARGQADVTPFVGYKRVASDNTLLFGVSVPLRVRDRNQAGVARAEADIKAAQTQLQLARNRALADV